MKMGFILMSSLWMLVVCFMEGPSSLIDMFGHDGRKNTYCLFKNGIKCVTALEGYT